MPEKLYCVPPISDGHGPLKELPKPSAEAIEYTNHLADDVTAAYVEFGLAPEYAEMLNRHLADLIVIVDVSTNTSALTVSAHKDQAAHKNTAWHREAIISYDELEANRTALTEALGEVAPGALSDEVTSKLALDWILFELSADALGNSIYMYDKFERYIMDFNGQGRAYSAELSTVQKYQGGSLQDIGPDVYALRAHQSAFKFGMGLALLHDDLLLMGLDKAKQAAWVISGLRKNINRFHRIGSYPPLRVEDLSQNITKINVPPPRPTMLDLAMSIVEPLDFDEESDW